jgi:hypothetical protein
MWASICFKLSSIPRDPAYAAFFNECIDDFDDGNYGT